MKVVITGSTGFVGKNLKSYFARNEIGVVCLDRKAVSPETITWERISDVSKLSAGCIVHLAGKAHDTSKCSSPEEYYTINTELTKHLFDQFVHSSVRDFIYFSSVKAVTDVVNGILDENEIPNPRTPYGQSKLKAEEYILAQDVPLGKRVIILRPSMIHGPENKGNLNLLFKIVKRGIPWPLAAFENKRSFLSIDNLCFLLKLVIENKNIPSGVYNCTDDESLATNELIALIGESIGKRPIFWRVPERLINGVASLGDACHFPLNSERLRKLTENYVVSNEKLKMVLGVKRFPVSAREGLLKTFKSFNS